MSRGGTPNVWDKKQINGGPTAEKTSYRNNQDAALSSGDGMNRPVGGLNTKPRTRTLDRKSNCLIQLNASPIRDASQDQRQSEIFVSI